MIRRIPVVGRMEELFEAYMLVREPAFLYNRVRSAVLLSLLPTILTGYFFYTFVPVILWIYVPAAVFITSVVAFLAHRQGLERIVVTAVALEGELPVHLGRVLGQSFRSLCSTLPGIEGSMMKLALYSNNDDEVYVARVDDPIELEPVPPGNVEVVHGRARKGDSEREVEVLLVQGICDEPGQAARLQLEPGWKWVGLKAEPDEHMPDVKGT